MPLLCASLIETWVVLGWFLLWCGSIVVVMRRDRLPVCLEDGLEGWSWWGGGCDAVVWLAVRG